MNALPKQQELSTVESAAHSDWESTYMHDLVVIPVAGIFVAIVVMSAVHDFGVGLQGLAFIGALVASVIAPFSLLLSLRVIESSEKP